MRQSNRRSRWNRLTGWMLVVAAPGLAADVARGNPTDSDADRVVRRHSAVPPASNSTAASGAPSNLNRSLSSWNAAPSTSWLVPVFLLVGLGGIWWFVRRRASGAAGGGRIKALDVIGKMPLAPRQTLYVVRLGRRVLLLGATGERVQTLSEVNDATEAAEIIGATVQSRRESVSSQFSEILKSAAAPFREPANRETAGQRTRPQPARPSTDETTSAHAPALEVPRTGIEELRQRLRSFAVNTTA